MTESPTARAIHTIGWSAATVSRRAGVDERTVRRWISGQFQVPAPVLAWLEDLARYHEARPGPEGRREADPP